MSQFEESQNTYAFPDTVSGTTLYSQGFEVLVNDAAPASALTAVSCVFAKDGATTLTVPVTIDSAANWQFTTNTVSGATMNLAEGLHVGDIKTTAADGTIRKYAKVTINILPSPRV